MFLIESHQDLPQGELLRREERLIKTSFVEKTQKSFSQSFFSLCNLPYGKVSLHKNTTGFSQSFFSLWEFSLRQILMNFDWVIFLYSLSLSSLCVIYPTGRAVHIKEQKRFSYFFFLLRFSLKQILLKFDFEHFPFFC